MWIEKYKPKSLGEVVGHEGLKSIVGKYIEQRDIPHFLFFGKPGTGKTLIAELVAKELLGGTNDNFIEMNASDDRTVEKVRKIVLNGIKHSTLNGKLRIILLDEADGLLVPAQEILRRPMEKSSKTRFIITANEVKSIIEAIKSRCMSFEFKGVNKEDMLRRLRFIRDNEHSTISDRELELIATNCNGDLRQAITELEKASMGDDNGAEIVKRYLQRG
ncbi:MAG: AAA family ATPase [Methanophagales archaeon ANME-1-THS]|nr:MAG: AAA family ATPase [Methanophagales archaeon ANME-1-THS]